MISGLSFVGIVVEDLEDSQKLYSEMLGLQPWSQGIVEMPGVNAVMFPLSDCAIELLQPTVGPQAQVGGGLARYLEEKGQAFCRLGLWTDDLDEETSRLKSKGFQVIDTGDYGRVGEEMGTRMAFVHPKSIHGVLVEIDQVSREDS